MDINRIYPNSITLYHKMERPMKDTHGEYSRITTDDSLRETILHGSEEYPFRYYLEDVWDFDFHCIDWHWHPEVEFVLIKKGTNSTSGCHR